MNIRYKELDKILISLEKRKPTKFSKAQISYIKGMVAKTRHKRIIPPIFHLKSE